MVGETVFTHFCGQALERAADGNPRSEPHPAGFTAMRSPPLVTSGWLGINHAQAWKRLWPPGVGLAPHSLDMCSLRACNLSSYLSRIKVAPKQVALLALN